MKKLVLIVLAAVMSFSLAACANNNISDIKIDGKKVPVTDFLTEYLTEYVNSEEFAEREEKYAEFFGTPETQFTITRVIELKADGLGLSKMSIHYLLVKADWWHLADTGDPNDSTLIVINYDTGEVFDQYMLDEKWLEDSESRDYWNYMMLNGPLVGSSYNGGNILNSDEKRTELSSDDIARINEAIQK